MEKPRDLQEGMVSLNLLQEQRRCHYCMCSNRHQIQGFLYT